jgi:hypothetical protein
MGPRCWQKGRQHILTTSLGNQSSPAIAHYGMEIYNNKTIMASIYTDPEVIYTSYFPIPQACNANMVHRSHVVMPALPSHINIHNSYSSTNMSRWSNHNAYITKHVSNINNLYVHPYSLTGFTSHCTPQTRMPMSN